MLERQVADLVDDDQPVAAQPGQFGGQPGVAVGVGQAGDPVGGGGKQHPVPVPGRGHAQRGGQMRLAGSWRSEQHDVAGLGEEPAGGQGCDLGAHARLGVEVELFQGFDRGEPGGADA